MRSGSRAFTLIELLVVVAIIAVLMAILLPSLGSARRQAASVKCLSGLRALAQGVQIFASENNGDVPYLVDPDWTATGYPAGTKVTQWYKAMTPYLTSDRSNISNPADLSNAQTAKVMQACPTWDARTAWPSVANGDGIYSKPGYGYNSRPLIKSKNATASWVENEQFGPIPNDGIGTATTGKIKLVSLTPSGERILFGDSVDFHMHLNWVVNHFDWGAPTASEPVSRYISGDPTRHGTQDPSGAGSWANYSFADGHGESIKAEAARRILLQLPR